MCKHVIRIPSSYPFSGDAAYFSEVLLHRLTREKRRNGREKRRRKVPAKDVGNGETSSQISMTWRGENEKIGEEEDGGWQTWPEVEKLDRADSNSYWISRGLRILGLSTLDAWSSVKALRLPVLLSVNIPSCWICPNVFSFWNSTGISFVGFWILKSINLSFSGWS